MVATGKTDWNKRYQPVTLGDRIRQREFRSFTILEAFHRPNLVLRPHVHRYPALTIVREGVFGLHIGQDTFECSNTGVFFKLGDLKHANEVGATGSRSLIIEIRIDHRDLADGVLTVPDRSFFNSELSVVRLAAELEREFRATDDASQMALEGLTLELLSAMVRASKQEHRSRAPGWMQVAIDFLHDPGRQRLGLGDIAFEIGVHPTYLARMFRRHLGCSLGEYARRLRIDFAARELRDTDRRLIEIGLAAGFHDQAHFSRCFKRQTGLTPSDYRRSSR